MVGGAEALGRVLDEEEAIFFAEGPDSVIVTGVTQNVHGNHRLGGETALGNDHLDLPLQALRTQAVSVWRDVTEHGGGAEHLGRLRGGDEGHIRAKYRIASANTIQHKSNLECVSAIGTGDTMLSAHKISQFVFQFLYIGSADELR